MAVMENRPPDFSLAYEVGTGGRQTGVCFSLSRFSGDLLGEVTCSSQPENLGRFYFILPLAVLMEEINVMRSSRHNDSKRSYSAGRI